MSQAIPTHFVPTEDPLSSNTPADAADFPAPEVEIVTKWKVACQGDQAQGLGHPRVWLSISPEMGFVDCGYCDKRFVIDPVAAAHGDH